MSCNELILNIDWVQLRKQKSWLLQQNSEEAQGLVHMLDAVQDYAVDEMFVDHSMVFGTLISREV